MPSPNPSAAPFIELLSVDSTNNYAMGLVRAGMAYHGTAVFTHEQTSGRGQRSKSWLSEKNKNIALSLILEPEGLSRTNLFYLSMAMAIGTLHFFHRHTGGEGHIKWPNDIYWRDRKAAGILIENVWQGGAWKYAIAGVGLNVNQVQFDGLHTAAVSLKQITGQNYDPLELARELRESLLLAYTQLLQDPGALHQAYRSHLYKLNETVRLKAGARLLNAIVKDVNEAGQLVVLTGKEEVFEVGAVEWMVG